MTNREAFTAAHALTRRTIQNGDNYRATFGACLRAVLAGYGTESAEDKAERIAALIEGEGMTAKVWDRHDDEIRVYISEELRSKRSWRKNVRDMGYVAICRETGAVVNAANRRTAFIRDLIAA
jgi:hypothetical protein